MRFVLILILLQVLLAGCSSLHTEVRPGFGWQAVSAVVLEVPESDPWGVVPVVREELRALGYAVAPAGSPEAQASVRFSWVAAPDLSESGEIVSRPKSLHLQFFAPDATAVATADYSPASSESPQRGIGILFRDLREKLREARENADPVARKTDSSARTPSESPSSWAPRLKSWGVEEWGKSRPD